MIIPRNVFDGVFGRPEVDDARTFLSTAERSALTALLRHVRPSTVIEFGVQRGDAAELMLQDDLAGGRIRKYVGIDLPADERPALESQHTEQPAQPAERVIADERFQLVLADSRSLSASDLPKADLIFVDGGHDTETVENDTLLAFDRIRTGGVVIWHDYNTIPEIGVREVIDSLNQHQGDRIVLIAGTWICFRFFEAV